MHSARTTQSPAPRFTHHVTMRLQERRIDPEAVAVAALWGQEIRRRGALFTIVSKAAIESARKEGVDVSAFRGVCAVLTADGAVVKTAYKRPGRKPKGN